MVIKNSELLSEKDYPKELKKELIILYEIGLEDYEIEYLIWLKTKKKSDF